MGLSDIVSAIVAPARFEVRLAPVGDKVRVSYSEWFPARSEEKFKALEAALAALSLLRSAAARRRHELVLERSWCRETKGGEIHVGFVMLTPRPIALSMLLSEIATQLASEVTWDGVVGIVEALRSATVGVRLARSAEVFPAD